MVNWKDIDINFTEELQKEWKEEGFSYEECKEWMGVGLKVGDASYARWLRHNKQKYPEQLLNEGKNEELKIEYQEWKEWASIHEDFSGYWGEEHQNNWKELSFIPQVVKKWINAGLDPKSDYELAAYCRSQGYQPEQIINIEETRKEFEEWLVNPKSVQEYLNTIYSHVEREKIKKLEISKKNLEGKLDLSGFTNLEKLNCSNNLLTDIDLTGLNPKKIKIIDLSNNNLSERDLTCFSELINLERISIDTDKERREKGKYNRFYGSLKPLESLSKLNSIIINNTNIDSGLEYLPENVSSIFANCSSLSPSSFDDLGCQKIYEQLKEYFETEWVEYSSSHPVFKALEKLDENSYYTKIINLEGWRVENVLTYQKKTKEQLVEENLSLQDQLNVLKKQFAREIKGYIRGKLSKFETQMSELETTFEQQIKPLKSSWNSQIKKKKTEITNILHGGKGSSSQLHKEIEELKKRISDYEKLTRRLQEARNMLSCINLSDAKELDKIQSYLTSSLQEVQKNDDKSTRKVTYKIIKTMRERYKEIQHSYESIEKDREVKLEKHINLAQKLTKKLVEDQQLEARIEVLPK